MGGYDITPECRFYKVGDKTIVIEKFDTFDSLDGQGWAIVTINQAEDEDLKHFIEQDEIKNAPQLSRWNKVDDNAMPFNVTSKDFQNCLRAYLRKALYWNIATKDLPEKKCEKIIDDFIKAIKGDL